MKTIKSPISKHQKLTAQLLLFIFLLESCHNNKISGQLDQAQDIRSFSDHLTPLTNPPLYNELDYDVLQESQQLSSNINASNEVNSPITNIKDNYLTYTQDTHLIKTNYKELTGLAADLGTKKNTFTKKIGDDQYLKARAEKRLNKLEPSSRNKIALLLENQVYISKEGYQIQFKQNQGNNLQATVLEYYGKKYILPVIIQPEFNFSSKAIKHPSWQKQYMKIFKDCIYIGQGLQGGGKKDSAIEIDFEQEDGYDEPKELGIKLSNQQKILAVQEFIEIATNNSEKAKDQDIVLVLGNTGAGKSTLINYLLGSELIRDTNDMGDTIAVPKDIERCWAKIGYSLTSETFLPSVYSTSDAPFVYCDCPGFNDTRTEEERLNTTIATELIINCAKQIRGIIVIIDVLDFTHNRGSGMRNLSLTLSELLKGKIKSNSILFVFNNKVPSGLGRKKDLENIHRKLSALENIEKEKLEKLSKQAKAGNNNLEEYQATNQILCMLKMINANKHNTIQVDIFDQFQSKGEIEESLQGLKHTPKKRFNFSGYDDTRIKFNMQLAEVVGGLSSKLIEFIQTHKNIELSKEKIESCKERIEFYETQILLINPEQKTENEDRIPELHQQIRACNHKIQKLEEKKAATQNKLANLTQEKAELNTDEEVCYWTYNAYGDADIEYNGPPFTRREVSDLHWNFKCDLNKVNFANEYINRQEGTYKATYKGYQFFSEKEKFYVSIYVQKKNIPTNKARIEQINQDLEAEKEIAEQYDQDIYELQSFLGNIQQLINYYNAEAQRNKKYKIDKKKYLEEELGRIQREKETESLKISEYKRIRKDINKYLTEQERSINAAYKLIVNGIGTESKLINKFKEYYQAYQPLIKKIESNYSYSAIEIEFPDYLCCPIAGHKFTDPVITTCGHTFNHRELLNWLNRQKTCPSCRKSLSENELLPNLIIRQIIEDLEVEKLGIHKNSKEYLLNLASFTNQPRTQQKDALRFFKRKRRELLQEDHDLKISINVYKKLLGES